MSKARVGVVQNGRRGRVRQTQRALADGDQATFPDRESGAIWDQILVARRTIRRGL